MRIVSTYLQAFGRLFTYNPRRNAYLWFGFLWGLPVPVFSVALDLTLAPSAGRLPLDVLLEHPVHFAFLAHPFLFALVFGAMGTVRHELEEENRRLIATLTGLASTDPLTGLHNRRYMLEELDRFIHRSKRAGQPFSVVLIDLDGFKAINDQFGHPAGDEILRRVADGLRSVVRQADVLARYGGDEFLLLVDGDLASATHTIDRAARAVSDRAGIYFSAGVAAHPGDGATPQELISMADARQARVKRKHHETTRSAAHR